MSAARYLDLLGVATRTGYSYDHVRRMGRTGQLPAADAEVGDRLGWLPATVDAWVATRTTAPSARTTTTTPTSTTPTSTTFREKASE